MNMQVKPTPSKPRALSLELVLVIALPLIAVVASSTSAYLAYVKGFTALPETTASASHHR